MFEKISGIEFSLSSLCNMNCQYCFLPHYTKEKECCTTTFEDLAKFLYTVELDDVVWINISGGEISIHPKEVEEGIRLVKRIEKKRDVKLEFRLTTNGTNFERILDWLDRGLITPMGTRFSWDGIHTTKTRTSYNPNHNDEFYISRIKMLGESKWNKEVAVRFAITGETIDDLYESVLCLLNNNCKSFEYYFIMNNQELYSDPIFQGKFRKQIELIGKEYVKRYNDINTRFSYMNWDRLIFFHNNINEQENKITRITHCKSMGRVIYSLFNGDIYPCVFYANDDGLDGINKIGNLKTGLNRDLINKFREQYQKDCLNKPLSCQLLHCIDCQGDNSRKIIDNRNKVCDSCGLRFIEKDVFNKIYKTNVSQLTTPMITCKANDLMGELPILIEKK